MKLHGDRNTPINGDVRNAPVRSEHDIYRRRAEKTSGFDSAQSVFRYKIPSVTPFSGGGETQRTVLSTPRPEAGIISSDKEQQRHILPYRVKKALFAEKIKAMILGEFRAGKSYVKETETSLAHAYNTEIVILQAAQIEQTAELTTVRVNTRTVHPALTHGNQGGAMPLDRQTRIRDHTGRHAAAQEHISGQKKKQNPECPR
jgi:hypothetical protein